MLPPDRTSSGIFPRKRQTGMQLPAIHFTGALRHDTFCNKYVNMTDINSRSGDARPNGEPDNAALLGDCPGAANIDLIELLFFAYRDFISDPDAILAAFTFGRAHHRVIHFVDRNPGLTVADLLDILKITKQSLGRVLKQLVDGGFIHQLTGPRDRRQRLLYATAAGRALAVRLSEPQSRRIHDALAGLDPQARRTVTRFLFAMIDPAEQPKVAQLVGKEPEDE